MKLVIEIDDEIYNHMKERYMYGYANTEIDKVGLAVSNGTPLDKHDEEIIAETVESIWGKPPYTELLDTIITDLESLREPTEPHLVDYRYHRNDMLDMVLGVIERYRNEVSS